MTNDEIHARIAVLCDVLPVFVTTFRSWHNPAMRDDMIKRIDEIQREIVVLARMVPDPAARLQTITLDGDTFSREQVEKLCNLLGANPTNHKL